MAKDKKKYLKNNWIDFIVFVPLIRFIPGIDQTSFFVIVWQLVLVVMLISRTRKTTKLLKLLSFRPAQVMLASFGMVIGVGTVLLMLPIATQAGIRMPLLDDSIFLIGEISQLLE